MPDHPPFEAPEEAWIAWVDEVAPCGGPSLVSDSPLAGLCRYRDRGLAAEFAKLLLIQREKERRGRRLPQQTRLGFEDGAKR
jgi:hypothetical protein